MKRCVQARLAILLAGILCAGLTAAWAVGEVRDQHETVRRDKHEVARMTQKMKTECVGRFLIDMPEEAEVEFGEARVDGINISTFDETLDEFHKRLAERENQIKAVPDRLGGNKNLERSREIRTFSGLEGKIFVHSRTITEGTQGNGLGVERYRFEGVTVEGLVHGNGISIDLASAGREPEWIEDIPELVNKLVPNPDNIVPSESGFCINRAYIRDPLTVEQREAIMMFARLPSHPDIDFMLILGAGLKPDEQGLLERSNEALAQRPIAERMRITQLRAEERTIGGIVGDELVELIVEKNDANVHSFWWEVNGTRDDILVPHLVFKMSTGNGTDGPIQSSLSDGAALGLWDAITSSIRVRPLRAQDSEHSTGARIPIGTSVSAGEPCPESGWWICGDGGNRVSVLGGQRQYIRKGERMPQALLLLPQTLWDKIRGLQPSSESKHPTPWQLVDLRARKRSPSEVSLATAAMQVGTTVTIGSLSGSNEKLVPVGTYSSTGLPCPASGWWRCEESHALDGTRWFAESSLLPPATFTVAPGVFGRSSTGPKTIQRRSAWRLMRIADAQCQLPGDSVTLSAESRPLSPLA